MQSANRIQWSVPFHLQQHNDLHHHQSKCQDQLCLQGRAIKLTTSRFYTPSGASIQGKGIFPDVVVEDKRETSEIRFGAGADREHDAQLKAAHSLLQPKSVMQSKAE